MERPRQPRGLGVAGETHAGLRPCLPPARAARNARDDPDHVAAVLEISQKRVSEIERGPVDLTKVDTLRRYADALGGTLRVEVKVGDETYQIA